MKTPLYDRHQALGAKMVDFGGWQMPLHYGSQLEEHHAVRQAAGVFDVSHMTVVEITGEDAAAYLRWLLANDIARLKRKGQAMYSAMLNPDGGVLDDLIVYDNQDGRFLMVSNAATRDQNLAWMQRQREGFAVQVAEKPELGILAVQGPSAIEQTQALLAPSRKAAAEALRPFQGAWADGWFIARTGYTGEQGYEILLPGADILPFFDALLGAGVRPIGLGARDTLRLEAGMNLYGSDMDATVSPLEANMGATLHLEGRDFIGAPAVRLLRAREHRTLTGVVLAGRGVLRAHYPLYKHDVQVGEVTSGAFSPTLQHSIGLARIHGKADQGDELEVGIRGKRFPVTLVRPPFVRDGKKVYSTEPCAQTQQGQQQSL